MNGATRIDFRCIKDVSGWQCFLSANHGTQKLPGANPTSSVTQIARSADSSRYQALLRLIATANSGYSHWMTAVEWAVFNVRIMAEEQVSTDTEFVIHMAWDHLNNLVLRSFHSRVPPINAPVPGLQIWGTVNGGSPDPTAGDEDDEDGVDLLDLMRSV